MDSPHRWGRGQLKRLRVYHIVATGVPAKAAAIDNLEAMAHIPFNGDHYIGEEIQKLVVRFKVQTIIETGTWSAHSTREFAKLAPKVFTIDATHEHLIGEFGPEAVAELEADNVGVILGDSSQLLPPLLGSQQTKYPALFYLDAHGGGANGSNVNPLLEELDAIGREAACRDRCVICIHDFLVPGETWGYNGGDWGRGFEPLSYGLIAEKLPIIYPAGHGSYYNRKAAGCQRGIIYIHPRE